MGWQGFLQRSQSCDHGVHVYRHLDELAESVGGYLAAGLENGQPALVVARPKHWQAFAEHLSNLGLAVDQLQAEGLLTVADAGATLALFMEDGIPSPRRFEDVVGGLVDEIAARYPDKGLRAFGEMVDMLSRRGEHEAAGVLERLWNDLGCSRDFALLCAYRVDLFDAAAQTNVLPDVCATHTHVKAALDENRLARAVDVALTEVLGAARAGEVYRAAGRDITDKRVPLAQLMLMWVSANLPGSATQVLAKARARYEQPAAA